MHSFVTLSSTTSTISVETSDACNIGVYPQTLTLIPSETPKVVQDESNSFNIEITCGITNFDLPALSDIIMPLIQTYSGHAFSASIMPTYCECLSKIVYNITYYKDGLYIPRPEFVTNIPETSGMFIFQA